MIKYDRLMGHARSVPDGQPQVIQSRAERALSLSETGARSRFSLSASASALNFKKRELELERRPTERFARTLTPSISQK